MKDERTDMGESDSPVVLGDGRTDRTPSQSYGDAGMGKGRAARSTEHSTHAGKGKLVPNKSVSRTLLELKVKAERDRNYRFRSLFREIDLRMLYDSFYALRRGAASGVDGVSYEDYESNLEANLKDLLDRLATHRYRAKLIRRRHIPKGEGKTRALGIPAIEDKIVQMSARRLLEAIYEVDFLDSSMGYRPRRGAREAGQKLRDGIFESRVHWIVEADIKGFFDNMDHNWLIQMLEQRVADSHFIRLIRKWLKAGIMEEDGCIVNPTTGTPQGGIVSPILANIYLHYVSRSLVGEGGAETFTR